MSYFVYYNDNNGTILSVSPKEMPEMKDRLFIKVPGNEALPFIQGKERTSKWKVDICKNRDLIKKDNYIFHQYNHHGFFNIESQQSENPITTIKIKKHVITITTENHNTILTFFLTDRDNPSYLLQKMTLEPNVVEKRFIAETENFSIFTTQQFGKIKWQNI